MGALSAQLWRVSSGRGGVESRCGKALNGEMGIGLRYYLFEEDGTLRHVAGHIVEGLAHGEDQLPQYAGQSLRSIEVVLETMDGKAVEIVKLSGGIWHFDAKGQTQQDWIESAVTASETHEALRQASTTGPVVDITGRIARRQRDEHNRWEPTPADINRIIHVIWPETAGGPVKRPKSISGVRKRRPPMTHEAKHVERECHSPVSRIVMEIDRLSDRSLKAFIAKLKESEEAETPGYREVWQGIRHAAENLLAISKARKSSKGKWFAVAERYIWEEVDHSSATRAEFVECVECKGKKAATAKCRELIKKYADQFDERVTVELQIYPEIEWLALTFSQDHEPG